MPFPDAVRLGAAEAAPAVARLVKLLDDRPDAVILANLNVDALPEEVQARLVEANRAGIGILIVRFGDEWPAFSEALLKDLPQTDAAEIFRGLGTELVPQWTDGVDFVRAFKGDRARVADMAYPGAPALTHCLVPTPASLDSVQAPFLETFFSLAGRAVRWAAEDEPECRIVGVESVAPEGPPETDIPPFLPQEFVEHLAENAPQPVLRPFLVHFAEPAAGRYTVSVRARYPYRDVGEWRLELPTPVRKGDVSYLLKAPVGTGDFFLDIWLSDRRGVVDWYSEAVHIDGWPDIADFQYPQRVLRPFDTLPVAFRVRPHFNRPRPALAWLAATDSLGRVVSERYLPIAAEGGLIETSLDFVDLIASSVRVDVFVADALRPPLSRWHLERAGHASSYLPVRHEAGSDFTVIAGGADTPEFTARGFHEVLTAASVDVVHTQGARSQAHGVYLENVRALPEIATFFAAAAVAGDERSPCLTAPAFWERQKGALVDAVSMQWGYGAGYYSLGAGNCLVANGDEVCRSSTCLASFSNYLAATYGSLAALNSEWGLDLDDWDTAARYVGSPNDRPLAPWVDFRGHMDGVFANAHTIARATVLEGDAKARVGFVPLAECSPTTGYDWSELASRLDWLAVIADPVLVKQVRSYQPRAGSSFIRVEPADVASPERSQWLPWNAALHQFGGVWIDKGYGDRYGDVPTPVVEPDGRLNADALPLVAALERLENGLGELLIRAERAASVVALYDSQPSYYVSHADELPGSSRDAHRMFVDLLTALGHQPDFVTPDRIAEGALTTYKLLVMPSALAMSDDDAAAVRQFHAGGGAVLADVPPGQYDEHGAVRDSPVLADVFGDATTARLLESIGESDPNALSTWIDSLNLPKPYGEFISRLGEFEGETFAFRYGSAHVLGLLAAPDRGRDTVRVSFVDGFYGHDMLSGEAIPKNRSAFPRLRNGAAALYAALPYLVERVDLETPEAIQIGRRLQFRISVRAKDVLPGNHVARVTFGPRIQGPMAHYSQTVECPGGQGTGYIPLALNDVPGVYALTAHDLLTGISTTQVVELVGEVAQ